MKSFVLPLLFILMGLILYPSGSHAHTHSSATLDGQMRVAREQGLEFFDANRNPLRFSLDEPSNKTTEVYIKTTGIKDLPVPFVLHLKWFDHISTSSGQLIIEAMNPEMSEVLATYTLEPKKGFGKDDLNSMGRSLAKQIKGHSTYGQLSRAQTFAAILLEWILPSAQANAFLRFVGGALMTAGLPGTAILGRLMINCPEFWISAGLLVAGVLIVHLDEVYFSDLAPVAVPAAVLAANPAPAIVVPEELPGNNEPVGEEIEECSICMSEFTRRMPRAYLPCTHRFHENCINGWIRTRLANGLIPQCPLCRNDI